MINTFIINSPIQISEIDSDKPYIELISRLCWCDYKNLNGVGISSQAIDSINTLRDMPVVAKISKDGKKFGSHEITIDDKGNIKFNTSAYGVHTDVWIAEDEVEIPNVGIKKLPCVFAKAKIWKRFSEVVNLIINKFTSPDQYNGGLWSSWELQGNEYHIDEYGGKIYDSFTFLSNCLIDVPPAYSNISKGLNIASDQSSFEKELEIAYLKDINKIYENEGGLSSMSDKVKDTNADLSAITDNDLYSKLRKAINAIDKNNYYYIARIYPYDYKVITYKDFERESEDDYVEFTYVVNSDETVSITGQKEVKMVFIPKVEFDTQLAKLNNELETIKQDLTEASKTVVDLTKEKEVLEAQIKELEVYKIKVEELEKVEQERLLAEKKEELKTFVLEDDLIEYSELENNEDIAIIFAELTLDNFEVSKEKIEIIKGKKAIQKYKESKQQSKQDNVETSAIKTEDKLQNVKTNIMDFESEQNPLAIMKKFLNK